jgi:hypothetical protein
VALAFNVLSGFFMFAGNAAAYIPESTFHAKNDLQRRGRHRQTIYQDYEGIVLQQAAEMEEHVGGMLHQKVSMSREKRTSRDVTSLKRHREVSIIRPIRCYPISCRDQGDRRAIASEDPATR